MKIYTLKVALRGVSPMIWRRIKVPGSISLAELHHVIQTIYDWDDENLHQFHIYGKDYGINYYGGIGYADNAHEVYLDDFTFDAGDKFSYEYNFFEHLMLDIRVEHIEESAQLIDTTQCIKGSGMPGIDKSDEMELIVKLLEMITNKKSSATRSDMIRLIEKIDSIKFNRDVINKKLNGLKSEHL